MRIGISSLMIQRGKTGVAQYVFGLLRALQQQASPHQFIIFMLEEDAGLFDFLGECMTRVTVPEKYRAAVKNILWHQRHLPNLVRQQRLDALHIPSYRRLLGRKPCPTIGTIHDLAPFRVPGKYDWKRMFYGRVIVRWLARRQDRIIAVSRNTAEDIKTFFGIPERQIDVIYNGLDHERFHPGPAERARTWVAERYQVRDPFFLYIARLEHPGKNHLRLIRAFEQFKEKSHSAWQLVFGGSDWHGAEAIHAAIGSSPQRQNIKCLGFVPDQELPSLYQAANAFVYPSLYEGFGLPPVEAMACGCPVICSTRGALGEVIGDAALKVNPESVDEIGTQLARLAVEEGTADRLRQAGLEQARKFHWTQTAVETIRVYERAASVSAARQILAPRDEHILSATPSSAEFQSVCRPSSRPR